MTKFGVLAFEYRNFHVLCFNDPQPLILLVEFGHDLDFLIVNDQIRRQVLIKFVWFVIVHI